MSVLQRCGYMQLRLARDAHTRPPCAGAALPNSWLVCRHAFPQADNTIADLEGLRRRSEQDEVAEEAAAKAAAAAHTSARKLRCALCGSRVDGSGGQDRPPWWVAGGQEGAFVTEAATTAPPLSAGAVGGRTHLRASSRQSALAIWLRLSKGLRIQRTVGLVISTSNKKRLRRA